MSPAALREAYLGTPLPAVRWDDAVSERDAAEAREAVARAGFRIFDLAHRGRYEVNEEYRPEALLASLRAQAEAVAARRLTLGGARWLRLTRGSYALVRDDRLPAQPTLELTLDVSASAVPGAEVSYRHRGQTFFVVPQAPRSAALVERGPTVLRYDRYLTHRVGEAAIYRLRLALFPA